MTSRPANVVRGSRRRKQRGSVRLSPTLAALVLIVAQFALRWPGTRDSWFYSDDLFFLSDIGGGLDDADWYFRSYFGHRMPFSFVLTKLVAESGTYDWMAAATQIAVMQVLAALAVWVMLRVLFGSRLLLLIPFALYLFSSAGAAASTWWAVAINQLPHQIALAGCITAHVLYHRTRHRRWVVVAALFLLFGFLTYTKTILLPLVLLFLSLAYFASGTMGQRIKVTIRRDFLAWAVYGTISGSYALAYVLGQPGGERLPLSPTTATFIMEHLAITVPTTLSGGPWTWSTWLDPMVVANPPVAVVVASWLVVAGVITVLALRRSHVILAMTLPLGYLLISLVFILVSRSYFVTFSGPSNLARHVQYLADFVPVAALALALMMMPLRGALQSSEPLTTPLLELAGKPQVRRFGTAALLTALLASAVGSNLSYMRSWNGNWDQRDFFTTAISEIRESEPILADATVPARAMNPLAPAYTPIRVALSPLSDSFTISRAGIDLHVLDDDGRLALAEVDAADRRIDDEEECVTVDDTARWLDIVPTADYPFWTAIDVRTTRATQTEIALGPRHTELVIPAGRQTVLMRSDIGYESAWLRTERGRRLCVEAVRVGDLVPRGAE